MKVPPRNLFKGLLSGRGVEPTSPPAPPPDHFCVEEHIMSYRRRMTGFIAAAPFETLEGRRLFAVEYTVVPIPLIKFGTATGFPRDVSDDGSVVVGSAYDGTTYTVYKWTPEKGNQVVGTGLYTPRISG